jgi:hypothetical protein
MKHPLDFIPAEYRKQIFFPLLFLTLGLFGVFWILDQPLRTPSAPSGIVSFELAHSVDQASAIVTEWKRATLPLSSVAGQANPDVVNTVYAFAAFGLGLDYLFMPVYGLALAFGTLLAGARQGGRFKSLGAVAGWGALAAMLFDAVENFALFQILLGRVVEPYPQVAFYCASIKFVLLIFGLAVALVGWLFPKK